MVIIAITWKYFGSRKHPSILGFGLIIFMFRADVLLYFGIILASYWFSIKLYKNQRFELMKWGFVVGTIALVEYNNRFR